MASAVNNARFLELELFTKILEIPAQKNSEIIQESSGGIFLSHSEEDYSRREAM